MDENSPDPAPSQAYRALDYAFTLDGDAADMLRPLITGLAVDAGIDDPHRIALRRVEGGGDFAFAIDVQGRRPFYVRTSSELTHHAMWEITNRAVDSRPGSTMLHGASVIEGATTYVICGVSGAGKSTLAAALMFRGATYLGDEIVEIASDGTVAGWLTRPAKVDTLGLGLAAAGVPGTPAAAIDTPTEVIHVPAPPVGPVAIPERTITVVLDDRGADLVVEHPPLAEAIASTMPHVFAPAASRQSGLEAVAALVSRSGFAVIRGGSVDERVETLRALASDLKNTSS